MPNSREVSTAGNKNTRRDRWLPSPEYLLLNSFSHLLITALALECGYPASSIMERVYAVPQVGYGVLLYTSSLDAELRALAAAALIRVGCGGRFASAGETGRIGCRAGATLELLAEADKRFLFVSSANFTEAAQNRNIEAGLLVESTTLACRMVEFLEGLIREQRVRRPWLT